jgi:hypothetical protein
VPSLDNLIQAAYRQYLLFGHATIQISDNREENIQIVNDNGRPRAVPTNYTREQYPNTIEAPRIPGLCVCGDPACNISVVEPDGSTRGIPYEAPLRAYGQPENYSLTDIPSNFTFSGDGSATFTDGTTLTSDGNGNVIWATNADLYGVTPNSYASWSVQDSRPITTAQEALEALNSIRKPIGDEEEHWNKVQLALDYAYRTRGIEYEMVAFPFGKRAA